MSKPSKSEVKFLLKISLPAPFIISAPYIANFIKPSSLLPQGTCLAKQAMLSHCLPLATAPNFPQKFEQGRKCKNQHSASRAAAEACGFYPAQILRYHREIRRLETKKEMIIFL